MKNIAIVMMLLLGCTSCQDSKADKVPQSVMATFMAKYPGESDPDWHIDDHGLWEANFKMEGEKYRADFKPNGLWVETENSINTSHLPQAVKEAIKRDYKDEKIIEVERVIHHSKGLFYDVEFRKKGKNKDVEFYKDGSTL